MTLNCTKLCDNVIFWYLKFLIKYELIFNDFWKQVFPR